MLASQVLLSPAFSGGVPQAPSSQHRQHQGHQHTSSHQHQKFERSASSGLRLATELTVPLMNSQPVRDALRSAQMVPDHVSHGPLVGATWGSTSTGSRDAHTSKGHSYGSWESRDGMNNMNLNLNSKSPVSVPEMLTMSHPSKGPGAIAAAAVGALRGAALLSPSTSDIPADNRIYVTWRVPSKATPLRVEDLWGYFSRYGQLAFCNPRPLRHSPTPRRTPSLSGAGYAFLGFAPPRGAEAVARVLSRPSHTIRGAELRIKPWRERDEATGSGEAPATIIAATVDAPHATVGDYYLPHPDSGLPVLASNLNIVGKSRGSKGEAAGTGLNALPNPVAHEKVFEADPIDEKVLFGENFFNLGNDSIVVSGDLDGEMSGGNKKKASDMWDTLDSLSSSSTSTWLGGGVWSGGANPDLARSTYSLDTLPPGADHSTSGAALNRASFDSSSIWRQRQVEEVADAPDDGLRNSRLWNYTHDTKA